MLIAQVAAITSRIRVGSGGIMLPNHAPLVIAEQFGTLEALFPGRIDLGLGRAPGTDQLTAQALRRGRHDAADVGGGFQVFRFAGDGLAADDGADSDGTGGVEFRDGVHDPLAHLPLAEVEAARVGARGAVEGGRRGDARVARGGGGEERVGVGGDAVGGYILVEEGVDEGGVGAVLEQAADEIG